MKQPTPREKALLYRLDAGTGKGDGVRRVLRTLNVAMVDLTPDMLGETVGACAGLPGFSRTGERYAGEAPDEDVLIMAGFSDDRISHLLAQLRTAGVPRIGLMATVTEHNRGWTLASLMTELACERRIMAAWMSLQQAVKAAEAQVAEPQDANVRDASSEADEAQHEADRESGRETGLAQALAVARGILASEEPPELEAIHHADAALRAYL